MLTPDRFVASKSVHAGRWLQARREGVTATQVAKAAAGPGGFEQAVEDYRADFVEQDNPYMAFGRAWEGPISMHLKDELRCDAERLAYILRGVGSLHGNP
jgi:hypothetical protein